MKISEYLGYKIICTDFCDVELGTSFFLTEIRLYDQVVWDYVAADDYPSQSELETICQRLNRGRNLDYLLGSNN